MYRQFKIAFENCIENLKLSDMCYFLERIQGFVNIFYNSLKKLFKSDPISKKKYVEDHIFENKRFELILLHVISYAVLRDL